MHGLEHLAHALVVSRLAVVLRGEGAATYVLTCEIVSSDRQGWRRDGRLLAMINNP